MRKRACDACYQRKIQCDAASPRCDWCRHHDLPCTFHRPVSTRRRGKGKRRHALVEQTEQQPPAAQDDCPPAASHTGMQLGVLGPVDVNGFFASSPSAGTVVTIRGLPGSCSPGAGSSGGQASGSSTAPRAEVPTPPSAPGPVFGRLHFAGCHLGDISLDSGLPFLSPEGRRWIAARTGEGAPFQSLCDLRMRHAVHPAFLCSNTMHLAALRALPERRVVQECVDIFSGSPMKRIWPLIDATLFAQTVERAYDDHAGRCSLEAVMGRACIFSFMAILTLHHLYPKSMPSLDSEECAVQAQYLLPQVLHETTLDGLQTCFMLGLYHLLLGQLQKAAVFHSVACRMMFTLGANTTVVPPLADDGVADASWRQKNQLRKLFWLIYSNDKEISLRTGQPPSINDDDCDLELPRGYLGLKYVHDRPESEPLLLDDTAVPLLPGDVRLDMIKSRTYTLLYSARSLRKSDAELISDIRQLDDELEAWRLSVPPGFRPILSLREKPTPPDLSEPRMMESVMIHVEYHHLVATIHEATSRCRSWSAEQSDEADGLDSSLALAVEASRSTLFYMHAIVHNLMGEAFWMAVFYPISAAWTIFCNLIYSPLGPHVELDLDLLGTTPRLIKEMRMRRLARDEMAHMRMVDDFVAELARLAHRAVGQAREGQGEEAC